jgi:chromosome segregation ATPase
MKRLLTVGIGAFVAVPFVSGTIVFAHEGHSHTKVAQQEATTTTSTEADPLKALQERINKRKADLKIRLTAVEKTRLQNKCQASQGHVSSVKGRIKGIETSRAQVYSNMTDRLSDLSEKLKNKGADTAALDAAITELKKKIETFNTDLAVYKQAVSDLADMDCKTDPDGFKASLQASRTAQETASKDAKDVRTYVNDTIKPLLKTIRTALEANATEGGQ